MQNNIKTIKTIPQNRDKPYPSSEPVESSDDIANLISSIVKLVTESESELNSLIKLSFQDDSSNTNVCENKIAIINSNCKKSINMMNKLNNMLGNDLFNKMKLLKIYSIKLSSINQILMIIKDHVKSLKEE